MKKLLPRIILVTTICSGVVFASSSNVEKFVITTTNNYEIMSFTLDNPNYGDIYKDWMYLGFNPVIKICAVYKDHGLLEDDMYTFSFDLGDFNRDSKMWDSGILTITQEKPCVEGTYKIQNHGTNDRFRLNSVERWSAKEIYRFNALSNTNAVRQGEPNGRQGERNARPSSSE